MSKKLTIRYSPKEARTHVMKAMCVLRGGNAKDPEVVRHAESHLEVAMAILTQTEFPEIPKQNC